jgi:hypothetical protein
MKLKMVMGDLPIAPIYFYNRNCFVHLAAWGQKDYLDIQ